MGTLDGAGKAANEIIEKVIDFTEEIAVRTVDVIDVIQESAIDFAQNAQEFVSGTEEFVRKKVEEASAAVSGKPAAAEQPTGGRSSDNKTDEGEQQKR